MNLTDAAQPPLFVPGAIPAFRLLEIFKKSRTHIALVVDEYGDVEGLATINDFATDGFEAAGLRFEVVEMDGKRIDKVLVQPMPSSSKGEQM